MFYDYKEIEWKSAIIKFLWNSENSQIRGYYAIHYQISNQSRRKSQGKEKILWEEWKQKHNFTKADEMQLKECFRWKFTAFTTYI